MSKARKGSIRWYRETYADGSACIRGLTTKWGGLVDVTDCRCALCRDYVRRYRGTRWLSLVLLLGWWFAGCGSVSEAPPDGAGGAPQDASGAAGAAGGSTGQGGAAGTAGASAAGRGGAAGTAATAGAGGTAAGGAAGTAGGAAGTAGGVSMVLCPADWVVQRGCSMNVDGAPCDVCHDAAGTPLRCATSAIATARVFCVPDCASCY